VSVCRARDAPANISRSEKYPPWESQSSWHTLYKTVNAMCDKLPRDLALTQANISAHHSTRSLGSFTLLHTLLLLSKMILHREWLPFLPFRCTSPKGPLDDASPFMKAGVVDAGSYQPFGHWELSASELFKSSKDLLNLLHTCKEWKVLAETPIVGFAAYMIGGLGGWGIVQRLFIC
jgi:hypothetical protein